MVGFLLVSPKKMATRGCFALRTPHRACVFPSQQRRYGDPPRWLARAPALAGLITEPPQVGRDIGGGGRWESRFVDAMIMSWLDIEDEKICWQLLQPEFFHEASHMSEYPWALRAGFMLPNMFPRQIRSTLYPFFPGILLSRKPSEPQKLVFSKNDS